MYNRVWLLLLFVFFAFAANAQTLKKFIQYGDMEMAKGNYYTASQYYAQGAEKFPNNLPVKYKLAEACRLFFDYKNAAKYYVEAIDLDEKKEYVLAPFWAGIMYKQEGEYDKAISFFKKYKVRNKTTDRYAQKATHEIEACNWAKTHFCKNSTDTLINIGDSINTIFSEFNAIEDDAGNIIFSSIRKNNEQDTAAPITSFYHLQKNQLSKLQIGQGEQEMHFANGVFNQDFTKFYFTECALDAGGKFICHLYESKYSNQHWQNPQLLDSKINLPDYTATQPAIGKDAIGNELLYYVSDRPDGEGGLDIWCAKIKADGSFENPINVGKGINTTENEITPFYDYVTDSFYFSSDWHIGYGGYDIFRAKGSYNQFSTPQNLGCQFNSPANDLYYFKSYKPQRIFVTSNRKGSKFLKAATCCNDIYFLPLQDTTPLTKQPELLLTIQENKNTVLPINDTIVIAQNNVPVANDSSPAIIQTTFLNIKQLLPVTLYFHNDEPECCNMRDTTSLNYAKTYEAYWRLKPEYEKNYEKNAVVNFFNNKVDDGYIKLIMFSAQLLDLLEAGKNVEIELQGYCSPLNFNEYNIHLGNRRVASLKNYFYQYRNGFFLNYIKENKLHIIEKSFGEETADKTISDSREDKTNAVYNPIAASERRVAIIAVTLK